MMHCAICNSPARAAIDAEVRNHVVGSIREDRRRFAPLELVLKQNGLEAHELEEHVTRHLRLPWPIGGGEAA